MSKSITLVLVDPLPGEGLPPLERLALAADYVCQGCRRKMKPRVWHPLSGNPSFHYDFVVDEPTSDRLCYPCHRLREERRWQSEDPGVFGFYLKAKDGKHFVYDGVSDPMREYPARIRNHGTRDVHSRGRGGGHNWWGVTRTDVWFRDELDRAWWGYAFSGGWTEEYFRCQILRKPELRSHEVCRYPDFMRLQRACAQKETALVRYLDWDKGNLVPKYLRCCDRHAQLFLKRVPTSELVPVEIRALVAA